MHEVKNIVQDFNSIRLEEMDAVKLMDRRDTKFVLREELLPAILEKVKEKYSVLEIKNIREQQYESRYFDTEYFKFYMDHHNGKAHRFKVRYRKYTDSNLHYLEVKLKDNKDNTRKKRIAVSENDFHKNDFSPEEWDFILKIMRAHPGELNPVLKVDYSRTTLVHKSMTERVTIDTRIMYSNGRSHSLEGLVIAEVKQNRYAASSDFIHSVHEHRLTPARFSKYCFGIAWLYHPIKQNRFKPRLAYVQKLSQLKKSA